MPAVELTLEGFVDGVKIPGFPYTKALECSTVRVFNNRISQIANYADILLGIIPSGSAIIRFLLMTASTDSLYAFNDVVNTPLYPITLPANHLVGFINGEAAYTSTAPLIQFKAGANPTDLFIAVGID